MRREYKWSMAVYPGPDKFYQVTVVHDTEDGDTPWRSEIYCRDGERQNALRSEERFASEHDLIDAMITPGADGRCGVPVDMMEQIRGMIPEPPEEGAEP